MYDLNFKASWLSESLVVGIMIAILFLFVAFVFYRRFLRDDMRKIKKILKDNGKLVVGNVALFDGVDHYVFVDYLILLPESIVMLKLDLREGYVFGGKQIDAWTCVKDKRSSTFSNPCASMQLFLKYIQSTLKFDNIDVYVLFGTKAEFPKGVPTGVLQLMHLEAEFERLTGEETGDIKLQNATRNAWNQLLDLAEKDKQELNIALKI